MPHGRVNGAHQFAQFGGNLIFPLYIFFVFPLKILIQPVLDGYPAAGKVAPVPVQTQAVFKITATLPWTYGKRIDTAGTGTGRVDGTAPIHKEDTGAVWGFCLEHIDREAFFGQRFRIAVAEQEILYSFDGLTFCSEIASQTVGVQTLHHYTAFDIAAALPALTAGKGELVFGADWLDLIHDFFVHFVPP